MNRVFRWLIRSLFAPVTGNAGAVASTLGFFLAFLPLPLDNIRLPILLAISLLFRLNIIALFLGALVTVFIPNVRGLPSMDLGPLEDFWIFSAMKTKLMSSESAASGAFGGLVGLVCYFFFHWFYNLGLKKDERSREHVFLDPAKRRWSIIKRMSAGFAMLVILVSALFIQSLNTTPDIPYLQLDHGAAKNTGIEPIITPLSEKEISVQLKQTASSSSGGKIDGLLSENQLKNKQEVYGFYVNWDKNSKTSFKKNKDSITVLVPDWLKLTPDLALKTSTDNSIVSEAKAQNIKILPLVNNVVNDKWDGDVLHRLFTEPGEEEIFIRMMLNYVIRNDFDGINIDFEEINPEDRDQFTEFMAKVHKAFKQRDLLVTVDVPPSNKSFDYEALAKNADRMILMLYDQHHSLGKSGPVAATEWVKDNLNQSEIPPEKLIAGLGSYGYDWEEGSSQPARPTTFREIMRLGSESSLKAHWSEKAGNPYVRYKVNDKNHSIWFLDAATFYNHMKLAIDGGSRGLAIWRLGSEDPSLWTYLNKPAETEAPSKALSVFASLEPDRHTGKGEVVTISSRPEEGKRDIQLDSSGLIQSEAYLHFPKPIEVARHGKPENKEVVLTFDDGPDPAYTPEILNVLDRYNVKGTFFIIGENAMMYPEIVKRMHEEGHEIGNHTFTHPDVSSISPARLRMELNATQRLVQGLTGTSMTLFRPPYIADAELSTKKEQLPILQAQKMGYTMVGQSNDSGDWQNTNSGELVKNVVNQVQDGNVILLHDAGGDRSATVDALPGIIEELRSQGYTFTTVGDLIGKRKSQVMPPAEGNNPYLVYDKAAFTVMQAWRTGLGILFYSAIALGILRLLVFVILSSSQVKKRKETQINPAFAPFVSVVIAAYNEEKVIRNTVRSILASDYALFEILIVDDGSKDGTARAVRSAFGGNPLVRLIQKPNGGKSSAVNLGFKEAKGEIVIALDADTLIAENAISLLVSHFQNEEVAAVSGNVKVGNKGTLLTNWQHIEYVTGFNLERRAFAELNCITVVPGAIGAWRKSAVEEVGYFKEDTLAEDTDITLALLRNGKKIEFEEKAHAYTEVPEDIRSLAKQRYRWVYGTLQCLWKHREALFNRKHHSLGYVALPNMWLFQYLYQAISPIADILFIMGLFTAHPERAAIGFLLFYLLDLFTCLYAFRLEKESPRPLVSLFLQRILYKQLMAYVVIKSILSAIKGVTVGWNKLKRKGNVTQDSAFANESM